MLWSMLLFTVTAFMLITSVAVITDWDRARYTVAPLIGMLGVWGVFAAELTLAASRVMEHHAPFLCVRVAAAVVIALCITPTLIFAITDNNEKVEKYSEPHIMAQVWRWSTGALNPPEGKIMIMQGAERWQQYVWDRTNGGYDGDTAFGYIVERDPDHQSPEAFLAAGVNYLFLSEGDLATDPALAAYTEDLLRLKSFAPHPRSGAETATYFYRLSRPQYNDAITFSNGITLVGYDLDVTAESITFRPYWQSATPINDNLSLFVHLHQADERTEIVAQADGTPANPARLTPSWDDPNEVLIGQAVTLTIPANTPPDRLALSIGLYNPPTGIRVPLTTTGDEYTWSLQGK